MQDITEAIGAICILAVAITAGLGLPFYALRNGEQFIAELRGGDRFVELYADCMKGQGWAEHEQGKCREWARVKQRLEEVQDETE
jgi:hypothetical protein